jgi:Transposase and inactivated derivatives
MKKIREYILKGKEIHIGLEDSKKTWKLSARSGRMEVHETSMPAEYENLRNYLRNKFPSCKICVMYEAGFRGFELHDKLVADGYKCVVTPPHTVTQEKCNRQKNDRNDCRRLSKNLANQDYRSCYVPSRKEREDRHISRFQAQIQRDITRACNRIRRAIEFHGLEKHFPPGKWTPFQYREAEKQMVSLTLNDSLKFVFTKMFEELRFLRSQKVLIVKRLQELGKSAEYRTQVELLSSAPGVGTLTAIRLALEWGDVRRFGSKEKFANFTGLIPSDYSSGEEDHKGHITKQGSRAVRTWLIECAWQAIRKDPILLEKYKAIVSRCGSGKKAIVAVAHKLAIRLRAVLISGQPYQIGLEA